jgi:hypothetical protein
MSLGTRWGLFRHYWTLISLGLTLVCTIVLIMHMPSVSATALRVRGAEPDDVRAFGGDLFHPGVGLLLLLAVTVLNVYKPAGLTAYGWRKQRHERHAFPRRGPERVGSVMSGLVQQSGAPANASSFSRLTTRAAYFLFRFAEMWCAMLVGMGAFVAVKFALSAQGVPVLSDPASVEFQVGMALFMVTPMAAWMRFRGCAWRECIAMSAAMLLPSAAVVVSSALALQDTRLWLEGNQHVLMLVGMLAFMLYRREHYAGGSSFGLWRAASEYRQRSGA